MAFDQEPQNRTLEMVLQAFDGYCNPKRNETVERYRFNMRNQNREETFDKYVIELNILATTCNYGALQESLIRDKIICGIEDSHLRERLLRVIDLDLPKCLQISKAAELSKERIKTLEKLSQLFLTWKYMNKKSKGKIYVTQDTEYRAISEESDESNDYFEINTVTLTNVNSVQEKHSRHIYASMKIIGKNEKSKLTRFQLDSGATCKIITARTLKELDINQLQKTSQILTMYNNTTIKRIGKCILKLVNPKNNDKLKAEFVVVKDSTLTPLLGSKAVQAMNLVTVNYENIKAVRQGALTKPLSKEIVMKEYADIFEGTGKLEGKYHLELDNTANPVVHPPRKVPVAIKEKLHSELERLTKLEIIKPVSTPTPWVSSLVTVVTPDKLRICIDPKHLNQQLKRSHYPLPTIDDLLPELSRAKVFSVVDAKNGVWHVELDEESSLLTTFNTPFGRYRWLRMPFGLSSAPEEYQRRQDQTVEGLPGVRSIVDDILIYGEGDTEEEAIDDHDRKFRALMERCRERNLKLNKEKLKLKLKEVRFIGHLVTSVSKFLPKLSDICEPLRKQTVKDSEFCWIENHDKALEEIKRLVTAEPVLRYYDPKLQLTVQSDASQTGLGAAVMQEDRPVAYASRALNDTETRYAQIEKELLSVIFGLEKFHSYTYDRTVNVISDHKPLESIMKKPLHAAQKRLQRMLLRLQKYDIILQYRPGKEMYLADTLSRAYLKETSDTSITTDEIESINLVDELPISEERISELQEHTKNDFQMQELKEVIQEGWPINKWNVLLSVSIYFDIRDELTLQNGLLFKGERVIIPKSLRTDMIKKIHSSHIGIEGCLRRARESLYRPGMNAEVKDFIQRCETCRTFERKQQKETLISHEIPSRPWSKVGIDLMTFQSKNYLVTVDYYSNYWEVDYFEDTLALTVIRKLRAQFARHGIPDVCFTDNGPQFDCGEFRKFSRLCEFKHDTSSPLYSQSNGKVEQAVQTVKRLMKKSKFDKKDPYLAFLDFRNTQTEGFDNSPAEKLMNRKTRTLLPTKERLLRPKVVAPNKVNIRSYEVDVGARTIRRNRRQLKHTLEDDNNEPAEIERDNSDFEHGEINNQDHCENAPEIENAKETPITTRSGRVVKPPTRFKDFVCE
ncbi:unnamed protein product [Mytilus coruscus]|uniref:RNA-directed DNA polymerase n=1 Tax=Mytilus coruscus TaxID=42192 RepID=A0A6J8DS85_MYTCO|nr:unnamed protein product [Mytilus coruscus]